MGLDSSDYSVVVGLVMNAERARLRKVYLNGLAITLANSQQDIPREIVAAMCTTKEQADRLEFEINSARAAMKNGF